MAEGAPDPAGERGDIGRGRPMEGWPQQHGSIGGYDPVDQFRYATPTQSGQQFGGWQYQQGHSMHQAGMTDQSTRHAYSNDYDARNQHHFVPIGMQPLPGFQYQQQPQQQLQQGTRWYIIQHTITLLTQPWVDLSSPSYGCKSLVVVHVYALSPRLLVLRVWCSPRRTLRS